MKQFVYDVQPLFTFFAKTSLSLATGLLGSTGGRSGSDGGILPPPPLAPATPRCLPPQRREDDALDP